MDPLTISATAVALITTCVQTVKIIRKTIETVKTAKKELLNVLNETNRMRLLLEQLRGLTHQLGSKNNNVLLAFDKSGCEEVLGELKSLVDRLSQAEMFVGFQFLVRRGKFDSLVAQLRMQEDGIRTVLLSVATESAVFTREYVQTLIDGANVQAVSIGAITQSPTGTVEDPPPPFAEAIKSTLLVDSATKPEPATESLPTTQGMESIPKIADPLHPPDINEMIALAEAPVGEDRAVDAKAKLATDVGNYSTPLQTSDSALWRPTSKSTRIDTQARTDDASFAPALSRMLSNVAIWHGQLLRQWYSDEHLRLRRTLADAAFCGNWEGVEAAITEAHNAGFKSWPNCYRIRNPRSVSGWTPLHQAAFLGAPEWMVRTLVEQGASRRVPTMWTSQSELPYRNMSALEIARFLGFKHLYNLLSPIVHHTLPCSVLQQLQQRFHSLIQTELSGRPEGEVLRLPELELLTELENPEMYFPLKTPITDMGYFYRLDGRELLVMSVGISSQGQTKYYRISETGRQELQDAVLFDMP